MKPALLILVIVVTIRLPVNAQNVLQDSLTRECYRLMFLHQCDASTYARRAADVSLSCGENYFAVAENFAATCTQNDAGEYCFNLPEFQHGTDTSDRISGRIVTSCASIATNGSSCSVECHSALRHLVDPQGCCFQTVWNERLSKLTLGYDVDIFITACNITPPAPCNASAFGDLTVPSDADSCSSDEFWSRISNYLCDSSVAQPYINALTKNSTCIPLARHTVNACSCGPNDAYCLDVFGTSFNPLVPERTIQINPVLNNVSTACANYSSFQSAGCPMECQEALLAAIDEVGCCINLFNDDVNEVLIPYFSNDVMEACEVVFPVKCTSDLSIQRDSGGSTALTTSQVVSWVCIITSLSLYSL